MSEIKMNFDVEVAKVLDVNCAIILSNIKYWVYKNACNNKHFYEGKYWTYNSIEAFSNMFEWLSISQIRRCLDKLEKEGYITFGNYNQSTYDRTKWYCVNEEIHLSNSSNGNDEIVKPIPYNKPDSNTDNKLSKILFSNSKWNDYKTLRDYLKLDNDFVKNYKGVDLKNYIEDCLNWSESKNERRTDRGWLSTLRQWMKRDLQANKLVKLPETKKEEGWRNQ